MLEVPSVGGRCDYKIPINVTEECNDCVQEYPPDCDVGEKVDQISCSGNKTNIDLVPLVSILFFEYFLVNLSV